MSNPAERFMVLWNEIGNTLAEQSIKLASPQGPYADLVFRHSEPWRVHRTIQHIEEMLDELNAFKNSMEARSMIELDPMSMRRVALAVWYQDAVCNPHATGTSDDNEERSADLFRATAERCGFPEAFTERVCGLILATKPGAICHDREAAVLQDLDVTIFGQSAEKFSAYLENFRREYYWMSEELFYKRHSEVLAPYTSGRSRIYHTKFFRQKYEDRACRNLVDVVEASPA